MKKILLFLLVAISVVSLGLTIYFFVADNEVITIKSNYLVVDVNDSIYTDGLLDIKNKDEQTRFTYSSSNANVLSFEDGKFVAKAGGNGSIVISTSNRSYTNLVINVKICDGSKENPYIIDSAEELSSIGKIEKYALDMYYELSSDIAFDENIEGNFSPIGEFSGSFDGKNHTISNISITDASLLQVQETSTQQESQTYQTNAGLFSSILKGGEVKNLYLENIVINTQFAQNIGSIAGTNAGIISCVQVLGNITNSNSTAEYVGGLVGKNLFDEQQSKIDRCSYQGGIYLANGSYTAGGLVGFNQKGIISECFVSTNGENVTIVNFGTNFGGIVGYNYGDETPAEIYDSFFYIDYLGENTTIGGGIAYKNESSSTNNIVYGNYFGGAQLSSSLTSNRTAVAQNTTISYDFNKYLSAEEFVNKENFINSIANGQTKTWNFASVWTMGQKFPQLNNQSSSASIYELSIDEISSEEQKIYTATKLYDVLCGNGEFSNKNFDIVGVKDDNGNYVLDFSTVSWKFGDENHPIANYLLGISGDGEGSIYSSTNCTIKNVTFVTSEATNNLGFAKKVAKNVKIYNLNFENITFEGENANYVGVVAGVSEGASVDNVKVENVVSNVSGLSFGTLFGYALGVDGHEISNVTIKNVNAENSRFVIAGGIVGYNMTNICGSEEKFAKVENVRLCANYVGGVAGYNFGADISYVVANEIAFNQSRTAKNTATGGIYSGNQISVSNSAVFDGGVYVGGVVGYTYNGTISHAYVFAKITAEAGAEYRLHIGGVAGVNLSKINRAYIYGNTKINVTGKGSSYIGGIAGLNMGQIANSVVDGASIVSDIISTGNSEKYLNFDGVSLAGGIAGLDYTTVADFSICQCVVRAKLIQGFYAGGLTGVGYGTVIFSNCGNVTKKDGGVNIHGFVSGGLSAVIGASKNQNGTYNSPANFKDCYTICAIESVETSSTYKNAESVLKLQVSAAAGLAVAVYGGATVRGCYAITTFVNETGASYATIANMQSYGLNGNIIGNVYQNKGTISTSYGTQISKENMTGADGYEQFFNKIGSEDKNVWYIEFGYPVIVNIDFRNPYNQVYPDTISNM